MSPAIISAIVGAIVGSAAAFILTWLLETRKENKRKKNVAIAIVYELRMLKQNIEDNLKAAEKKFVIFGAGLSDVFYKTILTELPNYGPSIFLNVKTTYSQIRQIDYLRNEFENAAKSEEDINRIPNLGEAYTASLKEALDNINISLDEMKKVVKEKHFRSSLPELKHLTEIEKILTDKKN